VFAALLSAKVAWDNWLEESKKALFSTSFVLEMSNKYNVLTQRVWLKDHTPHVNG
jgi:hypothetical protein